MVRSVSKAVLGLSLFVAAAPATCLAKTYNCYCVNDANHLVKPGFKVKARSGIAANDKAEKKCRDKGFRDGTCTGWEHDRSAEAEALEEAVFFELLFQLDE